MVGFSSRGTRVSFVSEVVGVRIWEADIAQVRDTWNVYIDEDDGYDWLARRFRDEGELVSLDDCIDSHENKVHFLKVRRLSSDAEPSGLEGWSQGYTEEGETFDLTEDERAAVAEFMAAAQIPKGEWKLARFVVVDIDY